MCVYKYARLKTHKSYIGKIIILTKINTIGAASRPLSLYKLTAIYVAL